MSGTGSGTGTPYGPPPEETKCDKLMLKTKLASPDPIVVPRLRIGDVLDIQIQGRAIVAVHEAGVAGSIVENVAALLYCLQNDYKFKGTIEAISGGIIDIEVSPA